MTESVRRVKKFGRYYLTILKCAHKYAYTSGFFLNFMHFYTKTDWLLTLYHGRSAVEGNVSHLKQRSNLKKLILFSMSELKGPVFGAIQARGTHF